MNNTIPLVERAILFATAAHAAVGQRRKYTGEPYIVHPLEVMALLRKHATRPVTDEMLAAAACHDVVEDTGVTIELIREVFGERVTPACLRPNRRFQAGRWQQEDAQGSRPTAHSSV